MSLVDAFVAAVILAGGMLSVAHVLSLATLGTSAAGRTTQAALLASQKIEELRAGPVTALPGELVDSPAPGFTRRWSLAPLPADPDHLSVIEVVVTASGSQTRMVAVKAKPPGFSLIELMIATLITVSVVGAVLAVVNPSHSLVRAQGEAADAHQRLRAAADALTGTIRAAFEVRPYRVGAVRDDGVAGIYYRPDTIALIGETTTTFYWKPDSRQLMRYDGGASDLPMVEHVTELAFEYFGIDSRIDPGLLADGPWQEDGAGRRFDADVHHIRDVRVRLTVEATAPAFRALVPDEHVVLDVALRHVAAVE